LLLQGGGVGDRIPRLLSHNHDPDGPEMGWDKEIIVVKCSLVVNSEITCCCREAVSEIEFPDYCRIITTPMDLSLMRESLRVGEYRSPLDLRDT
jgi:hypothetical protein